MNNFSSKLTEHEKYFSKQSTYSEEIIVKVSVSNRVVGKTKAAELEPEKKIKKKFDEINPAHIKNADSIYMKISATEPNSTSSSY